MTTSFAVMTTQEIANRFNELAGAGSWEQIQNELFSEDAESIEPLQSEGLQTVSGLAAIREKGRRYSESIEELHSGYSKNPIVAGNHFAVAMGMECTFREIGRLAMDEIAVYEVKEGKIVKEQFFY